jgi:hypothetical protein
VAYVIAAYGVVLAAVVAYGLGLAWERRRLGAAGRRIQNPG